MTGSDATPVINAAEQQLTNYLGMPTQQLLSQLGLQQLPMAATTAAMSPLAANPGGPMNSIGPAQLISPVVQALSTLGTGQFGGMDPTSMLSGISNAFDSSASPVQQALGTVGQGWQGASATAAAAKASTALTNSSQVATQANGLSGSLSAAVASVSQAQTQLISIIDQFYATVAAIGPSIIFPWGWAAVLSAASQAVTQASGVMTETQGSLATQASNAQAIGSPVNVTSPSQLGTSGASMTSAAGPLSSLTSMLGGSSGSGIDPTTAMSMLSPVMMGAMAGISPAMSAASGAGHASPAAADAATGALAGSPTADPNAGAAAATLAGKPHLGGGGFSPGGGGGVGTTSAGAQAPRLMTPAMPVAPEGAATVAAAARPVAAGAPMAGGGGMMGGAPMSNSGHGSGAHTAASYLHTSDQGGKVVRDRSTVAPPVIGEADPNDTPDIELRI
jgi:hypothetical protein